MALSQFLQSETYLLPWFGQGSHVDEYRKILYVETPKVACSSIKLFLRNMVTFRPIRFNPHLQETRFSMFIHDRSQSLFQSLVDFPLGKIDEICESPEWFKFCVIRHPVERFFSAWRDKIFLCEPGYEKFLSKDGRKFVELSDFVAQVVGESDPMDCDIHWRSQVSLLRPESIKYSAIYDLKSVKSLPKDLKDHLEKRGISERISTLPIINDGLPVKSDGLLTAEIVRTLNEFYVRDFDFFRFPEHELPDVPEIRAESLTNGFTDAIFDRNRVIAAHALMV